MIDIATWFAISALTLVTAGDAYKALTTSSKIRLLHVVSGFASGTAAILFATSPNGYGRALAFFLIFVMLGATLQRSRSQTDGGRA